MPPRTRVTGPCAPPTFRGPSESLIAPQLLLASASPRRAALLESAGIRFVARATEVDETPIPSEDPVALARRLARAKADAAHGDDGSVVLAADTVVWDPTRGIPMGKPRDEVDAASMLGALAGRSHRVTTAWALAGAVAPEVHATTTEVSFRRIDAAEIAWYVATGEWRDKAGGYAIQGHAAGFVTAIHGSYTAVVGLPLAQVIERLVALGTVQR